MLRRTKLTPASRDADLALLLSGGGARAAYQVGVLRAIVGDCPEVVPGILTGVSAGAINAAYLAARQEPFPDTVAQLADAWTRLHVDDVFTVDLRNLAARGVRWGGRLLSGGQRHLPGARSLVDTAPLQARLERLLQTDGGEITGIARNVASGRLRAVALTASSYSTGQSVTWVQSRQEHGIATWERPLRTSLPSTLRVDHVMASAALPFFFPAVEVDGRWYGDGGVRLTNPLSPAVHLGARRIIAVSTRVGRSREEADRPVIDDYPPPAQIAGVLYNAFVLDPLDTDALELQRINRLVGRLREARREGARHIDLLLLRPSVDLGAMAAEYEPELPRALRLLTRGLGTGDTRSGDMLSLMMFHRDYIRRLIDLGESDARTRIEDIRRFLVAPSRPRRAWARA